MADGRSCLTRILVFGGWSVGAVASALTPVYWTANYGGTRQDIQRTYMAFDPILWVALGTTACAVMAAILGHAAQVVCRGSRA